MLKYNIRRLWSTLISEINESSIPRHLFRNSLGVQSARIEINGACNAKCTFCHSGSIHYDRTKLMEPSFFEEIIAHLQEIGLLTKYIWLYDRGEPLLHPKLGDILDICASYGVRARLSTNASSVPNLTEKQWKNIAMLKVSLSGLSEATYGRVHGLNIARTLENIKFISQRANIFSFLQLSWHRYRFNLHEEESAEAMARKFGYFFSSIDAEIIEVEKLLDIAEDRLSQAEIEKLEEFLLIERSQMLSNLVRANRSVIQPSNDFLCVQWDQLAVNYDGELLRCCGLSPYNAQNRLGSLLSYNSKDEIKKVNYSSCEICKKCIRHGIAEPSQGHFSKIWD